jgi:hypothetical protein
MMAVDHFIKQNRVNKYYDDFKSYKHCRVYPHPLFSTTDMPIVDEEDEVCPCCKIKNDLTFNSVGRKKCHTHQPVKKDS